MIACGDEAYVTGKVTSDGEATTVDACGAGCETAPEADWSFSRGGAAHKRDEALGVAIDPTGRIVVVGHEENEPGRWSMFVLALDPGGGELWTRRMSADPALDAGLRDVVIDRDGTIYVAGWDATRLGTVRRLDSDGNDVWTYLAPTPEQGSSGVSALVLAHESLYSLGEEYDSPQTSRIVVRRHDLASGEPMWTTVPPDTGVRGFGLAEAGGRLIAAGGALIPDDGKYYPMTAVFDANGGLESLVVETDRHGTWHDAAAVGSDGDVVFTGWWGDEGAVRRIGPDGGERWTQLLDPSDYGYGGLGVAVAPDHSLLIAGSRGYGPAKEDLYMARLGSDGAPIWTTLYDNAELGLADRAYDVAIGPEFVVVVGFETVGIGDTDLWIRRYPSG